VMTIIIATISRPAIDLRVRRPFATLAIGIAVFLIWIAPDHLIPGYRSHWLFTNSITGQVKAGLPESARSGVLILALRFLRAAAIVPIAEELFWRGWLLRWLISPKFTGIELGTYSSQAFWIASILFAAEHGPFWDVGLVAGVIYNWWMVRTKSLGDLILAHAITNACLGVFVIAAGKWEYWA